MKPYKLSYEKRRDAIVKVAFADGFEDGGAYWSLTLERWGSEHGDAYYLFFTTNPTRDDNYGGYVGVDEEKAMEKFIEKRDRITSYIKQMHLDFTGGGK